MKNAEKPETSFEFICEWFERAATNAKAQGKADSAQLWQDGLDHLQHIASQRNELVKALTDLYTAVDSCVDLTPEVMQQARAALAKAGSAA